MTDLQSATLRALDGLLRALAMEALGDDRFRAAAEPDRFSRIFGGQLLAQALYAASTTVQDKEPHSLHAYFVSGGAAGEPVDLTVERVRDGRSTSTRQVTVAQAGRPLLIAMASFHRNPPGPELADPSPTSTGPESIPLLQDWVANAPVELRRGANLWVETPPPLQMRMSEAPRFMGGALSDGSRAHWMRLPRDVGDDPVLHAALLAYASDYLLLDMAFRSHPDRTPAGDLAGVSLDHAIWLHRPVRFDGWHLYTQELLALAGHRGLVRGAIHDRAGHLVASVTQEVLVQ